MTKAEIISFVKNELGKVDKTNKYHPVVIEKAITLAFNQGYNDVFDQDPRLLDNYTVTYPTVAIAADGTTAILESTLPAEYVPFKDKNSGVRNIATIQQSDVKFFPASKREFEILPNTLIGELNTADEIAYYVVRKGTVEYYGVPATIVSAGVRMDIVIPFDNYAADDTVIIPFGKDIQLIMAIIEVLRSTPNIDLIDNNTDTE